MARAKKSGDILKQIEEGDAEAEKLRLAAYTAPADGETPVEGAPVDTGVTPTEETPAAATPSDQVPGEGTETPEQKAERERLEREAAAAADAGKDFKALYDTLQGKYNAEVPRLSEQIRDANEAVKSWREYATSLEERQKALEEEVRTLRTTAARPEEKVKTADLDLSKNPELSSLLVDYPGMKVLLDEFQQERNQYKKMIEDLEKKANANAPTSETVTEAQRLERFRLDMVTLVGRDWEVIDHDPKFVEFLQVPVPYTGKTRLQIIQEASKNRDANSVAQFFNDFKAARTTAPAAAAQPNGSGTGDETGKRKVDDFVSPPKPKGAGHEAPKGPANAPEYTREDYNRFADEVIRRKFNPAKWGGKTEAELDKIFDTMIANRTLV